MSLSVRLRGRNGKLRFGKLPSVGRLSLGKSRHQRRTFHPVVSPVVPASTQQGLEAAASSLPTSPFPPALIPPWVAVPRRRVLSATPCQPPSSHSPLQQVLHSWLKLGAGGELLQPLCSHSWVHQAPQGFCSPCLLYPQQGGCLSPRLQPRGWVWSLAEPGMCCGTACWQAQRALTPRPAP